MKYTRNTKLYTKMFNLNLPNTENFEPHELFDLLVNDPELSKAIQSTISPKYLCWDKAKYKTVSHKKLSSEKFWALIKFHRKLLGSGRESVIVDEKGAPFVWNAGLPHFETFFHEVDLKLGGRLTLTPQSLGKTDYNNEFIARGILEEAIASSQLEGASTTRDVAKKMILENRRPQSYDEKMIFNNYRAMQFIREELVHESLSLEKILELHTIITQGTLKEPDEEGRLRNKDEKIVVSDSTSGEIYHVAPDIDFVQREIEKLVHYANDKLKDTFFMHPVLKAVALHFWIGYLHPFTDGNGRLARAIFYWYLLKNNYWGFGYLPLSKIIKNSPIQYGKAYIYTEQDDNDLTYFFDYNIQKIQQAITEFEIYVSEKEQENKKTKEIVAQKHNLNARQVRLLQYFDKNKNTTTTIKTHMSINHISRMTAITDLDGLKRLGFLSVEKINRKNHYMPTEKAVSLFR